MCRHLFVYGTLLPGCAPDEVAHAAAKLRLVGEATVAGKLYDLGHFPGAILSNDPQGRIAGLVFQLPNGDDILCALDEYEEYFPNAPEMCQFIRIQCNAQMKTGSALPCWIYVYVRDLTGVRRIEDGVWQGLRGDPMP
jgi:gamma-glutamylcyclotransferase (GGCT)/AIG2-like uncharacterized protein YtfP